MSNPFSLWSCCFKAVNGAARGPITSSIHPSASLSTFISTVWLGVPPRIVALPCPFTNRWCTHFRLLLNGNRVSFPTQTATVICVAIGGFYRPRGIVYKVYIERCRTGHSRRRGYISKLLGPARFVAHIRHHSSLYDMHVCDLKINSGKNIYISKEYLNKPVPWLPVVVKAYKYGMNLSLSSKVWASHLWLANKPVS